MIILELVIMGRMSKDAVVVTFIDEASGRETAGHGREGESLLEMALASGVAIEHSCGGACACSTCHVRIEAGKELLSEALDNELDQVEQAPGYGPTSRLACQAVALKGGEIRCVIPKWNRNAVKEG